MLDKKRDINLLKTSCQAYVICAQAVRKLDVIYFQELKHILRFVRAYFEIGQQPVDQLPNLSFHQKVAQAARQFPCEREVILFQRLKCNWRLANDYFAIGKQPVSQFEELRIDGMKIVEDIYQTVRTSFGFGQQAIGQISWKCKAFLFQELKCILRLAYEYFEIVQQAVALLQWMSFLQKVAQAVRQFHLDFLGTKKNQTVIFLHTNNQLGEEI